MAKQLLLRIQHLTFGYEPNKPLFVDRALDIYPGERIQVAGPNGVGKTTLLKILSGMMRESELSYQASWKGQRTTLSQLRREIAFVLDEPQLFLELSGFENIEVFRLLWGCDAIYSETARSFCQRLGLDEKLLQEPVKNDSLGTQHKLFLTLVISRPASIYLLDEPFNTLDVASRQTLAEWMSSQQQKTFLIVSHLPQPGLAYTRVLDMVDWLQNPTRGIAHDVAAETDSGQASH
ncbi:MAG: ATP-binding cassette domain-containing protein [Firmicutes bacterium]|nr:ATP-binding cassette domain-containing protein [Bacillota bacterium]